ncbi:WD repeat-containing protein 93-like [Clytia hemisphaerica]|uniref:Uncharacterized protein n=1 Tax=Clytia hemisphaerica TaxID=252671 RepID=A0A7M5UYJ0_9CNID
MLETKSKMRIFNRYEPPSPSMQGDENIDESFLKDVDRLHDILPQPFRRIDKILTDIFDLAWIQIEQKESEKQYSDNIDSNTETVIYEEELFLPQKMKALELYFDNLFVGTTQQLQVYKMPGFQKVVYNQEDHCFEDVVQITTLIGDPASAILLLQHGKEQLSVVGFKDDIFHPICNILEESKEENPHKIHGTVLAKHSHYMAVSFEGKNENELLVYRLPVEDWLNTLRNMVISEEKLSPVVSANENLTTANSQVSLESQSSRLSSNLNTFARSPQILQLQPLKGKANTHSMTTTLKETENSSNMIGQGNIHLLTSSFFENLQMQFDSFTSGIDMSEHRLSMKPTCHFLKGQLSSNIFKGPSIQESKCNAIGVWWENRNQFLVYSLQDTKHSLQSVLPHSGKICLSSVNEETNLIAVALESKCITIWNRYTGEPINTLACEHDITMLQFTTVYDGSLQTKLIYGTSKGKLLQISYDQRSGLSEPLSMDSRSSKSKDQCNQVCATIPGPMNLLCIIWKSGHIFIYDVATCTILCQLELFNSELPLGGIDGNRIKLVFNKNTFVAFRDESTDTGNRSRLFYFNTEEQSILKPFLSFVDTISEEEVEMHRNMDPLETQFVKFLRERIASERSLKTRMAAQHKDFIREAQRIISVEH